jgi:hypothetical protein
MAAAPPADFLIHQRGAPPRLPGVLQLLTPASAPTPDERLEQIPLPSAAHAAGYYQHLSLRRGNINFDALHPKTARPYLPIFLNG